LTRLFTSASSKNGREAAVVSIALELRIWPSALVGKATVGTIVDARRLDLRKFLRVDI
jgi:hypothetical protein